MKKFVYLFYVTLACMVFSCQNNTKTTDVSDNIKGNTRDTICKVNFEKSETADRLYLDIKTLDPDGKKVFLGALQPSDFIVTEKGNNPPEMAPKVDSVIDIRDKKCISDKISMLFLVDRGGSISQEVLTGQYNVINNLLEVLPKTKMYLAFMDDELTESMPITRENFAQYKDEFKVRAGRETYLYKAILAKMDEMAGRNTDYYPEVTQNVDLQDTTWQKMLFVFTDGKVKNEDNYIGGNVEFNNWKGEIIDRSMMMIDQEYPYIPIHCIYIGSSDAVGDIQLEMEALCATTAGRDAISGEFHQLFSAQQLQDTLMGTINSMAADYRLVLKNPMGKVYDGSEQLLTIQLKQNGNAIAMGELRYVFGNQHVPIVVASSAQPSSNWGVILKGIVYGLIFVLLAYLILQFLLPWIQYKIFCKKYIIKYKSNRNSSDVEAQQCYHCKEKFQDGDEIVVKCEHVVHLECWKENRNRCPEYGIHNCTKGIHYYNQQKLSDSRNAPYFLMWMVYGLLAGLVSWVFMRVCYSESLFSGMIGGLTKLLSASSDNAINFLPKMQAMLLCGLLLGFFITFFFTCQIEFRKKNRKVWGLILLRSLVGSALGFVAFLLGGCILILLGKDTNCIYTDWIPWALFAVVIAFTLAFKTDINLKSALIGGLISVFISFIVLFAASFAKEILSMFSYMIYAAGFGIAIAVVHHVSEKYFLRVSGPIKERDIAIYKWMSVSGGFNRVTIGKSIDCILEMNWDDADNISDKQVEIYLENDRPYCKALTDGTRLANGQMLSANQVILLTHGSEFTIGNSTFTYIEKDK